ncbi:hypothetical protein KAM622c_29430 [Klebsiella quasipneumoniae subsp. quasipneumoniae]|nr:hypothetical protein KAM622c_29430 [Klebsiella quasipneumoniae subsp. quasipneumoniae]
MTEEEEAGFIAHIKVNALTTGIFDHSIAMTRLIQGLVVPEALLCLPYGFVE